MIEADAEAAAGDGQRRHRVRYRPRYDLQMEPLLRRRIAAVMRCHNEVEVAQARLEANLAAVCIDCRSLRALDDAVGQRVAIDVVRCAR